MSSDGLIITVLRKERIILISVSYSPDAIIPHLEMVKGSEIKRSEKKTEMMNRKK